MAARDTNQSPIWHAMGADETLRQLGGDAARGLDAGEAAATHRNLRAEPVAGGGETGTADAVPAAVRQYPCLYPARRRLREADARACGWTRRSSPASVVINAILGFHSGRQGREGVGFHPQHAFRGGARQARRRNSDRACRRIGRLATSCCWSRATACPRICA